MKFLHPTKNIKTLYPSVVCIDPAVLSSLMDSHATNALNYRKGVDPRKTLRLYQPQEHQASKEKGIGLFIITETRNFFWGTVNESNNIYQSINTLLELITTYTSEYYSPVVLMETPIPKNPKLNQTAGAIAGAIFSVFGAKTIWCNPINWKGYETQQFSRFLKRFGIEMEPQEIRKEFTPHEIDATLLYAYVFEDFRAGSPPAEEEGEKGE